MFDHTWNKFVTYSAFNYPQRWEILKVVTRCVQLQLLFDLCIRKFIFRKELERDINCFYGKYCLSSVQGKMFVKSIKKNNNKSHYCAIWSLTVTY